MSQIRDCSLGILGTSSPEVHSHIMIRVLLAAFYFFIADELFAGQGVKGSGFSN